MAQGNETFDSLKGHFLIAMPQIDDLRFEKAVIYIFDHTRDGVAGIVINRPAESMSFIDILDQLKIEHPELINPPPIVLGGPDKFTNGFILHSPDYCTDSTISVSDSISLTTTQDVLYDISQGRGPSHSLISLGCATWIRGQLEDEIMSNLWLTTKADDDIIFNIPFERRWNNVLNIMGISSQYLSTEFGKA